MKVKFNNRHLITIVVAMLFSMSSAYAQSLETIDSKSDSVAVTASVYFAFDVSSRVDSMDEQQVDLLVSWILKYRDAKVRICGWADSIGASEYNKRLSKRRAETASRLLIDRGVESERVSYVGMGIDRNASSNREARRSTIVAIKAADPLPEPKPEPKPDANSELAKMEKSEPTPEPEPVKEPEPIAEPVVDITKERGNLSLRTNLLYLAATSFNLGIEWNPLNSNLGFIINGGYAPFGADGNKRNLGAAFFSPEVRYYFGEDKRWFAGATFLAGLYNYKLSDTGYQGSVYAGGFTGGYRIELSKTFDMDFSLGLGFGQLKYDKYYHNGEGNVLLDENVKKNSVMPIQAGVSLIWKIF